MSSKNMQLLVVLILVFVSCLLIIIYLAGYFLPKSTVTNQTSDTISSHTTLSSSVTSSYISDIIPSSSSETTVGMFSLAKDSGSGTWVLLIKDISDSSVTVVTNTDQYDDTLDKYMATIKPIRISSGSSFYIDNFLYDETYDKVYISATETTESGNPQNILISYDFDLVQTDYIWGHSLLNDDIQYDGHWGIGKLHTVIDNQHLLVWIQKCYDCTLRPDSPDGLLEITLSDHQTGYIGEVGNIQIDDSNYILTANRLVVENIQCTEEYVDFCTDGIVRAAVPNGETIRYDLTGHYLLPVISN